MGNIVKTPIEAIRTYHLILDAGHHLDLFETFYVPSISRNLVSMSKLDTLLNLILDVSVCLSTTISLVRVFFLMVYAK